MQQRIKTKEDYQQRINLLIEYINTHLEENIDLALLADLSGFSPWHFHRITSAYLGEPLGKFITRVRIEKAARLLRHTDLSIEEIAYKTGYNVPSSLSKIFKQCYGISPNTYRTNKNYFLMKPTNVQPELNIRASIRNTEPENVIYLRLTGDYQTLNYMEGWKQLLEYCHANALPVEKSEYLCIYHDDPKVTSPGQLRTDLCLTLSVPATPRGEIGIKEIAGGKYAVFLYQGPYANLGAVYDTIYIQYLPELNCQLRNEPAYEKYLNHPCSTAPEELLTEIYIPVE